MCKKAELAGFILLATWVAVSVQGAQASDQTAQPSVLTEHGVTSQQPPVLQREDVRYRLCKGDVLTVRFAYTPDYDQEVRIQPDGFVTLRELGDVEVEGQTVPELRERLERLYSKILRDPAITVVLKEFEQPYFVAAGELERPGKYELRGPVTAAQGIAIAGGFNERAKHSQVLLFRSVTEDWVEVKELNIKKMMAKHDLQGDFRLQPGDILFVPQNVSSKIRSFIPRAGLSLMMHPRLF